MHTSLRHRDYKAIHIKKMSSHRSLPYRLRASIADDLAYMDMRLEDEMEDRNRFINGLKDRFLNK